MKKELMITAVLLLLSAAVNFGGCARQNMNGPGHGSMDTMSEETMKPGGGAMDENGNQEMMPNNSMEKNMQ